MPDGNAEQARVVANQVAEAFISEFKREQAVKPVAEIPPPLKWAGGIVAALLIAGAGGTATWLVSTVNEMQLTLARMDERMEGGATLAEGKINEIERRVGRLERYHEEEGR